MAGYLRHLTARGAGMSPAPAGSQPITPPRTTPFWMPTLPMRSFSLPTASQENAGEFQPNAAKSIAAPIRVHRDAVKQIETMPTVAARTPSIDSELSESISVDAGERKLPIQRIGSGKLESAFPIEEKSPIPILPQIYVQASPGEPIQTTDTTLPLKPSTPQHQELPDVEVMQPVSINSNVQLPKEVKDKPSTPRTINAEPAVKTRVVELQKPSTQSPSLTPFTYETRLLPGLVRERVASTKQPHNEVKITIGRVEVQVESESKPIVTPPPPQPASDPFASLTLARRGYGYTSF